MFLFYCKNINIFYQYSLIKEESWFYFFIGDNDMTDDKRQINVRLEPELYDFLAKYSKKKF